jgi:hypothetical protein
VVESTGECRVCGKFVIPLILYFPPKIFKKSRKEGSVPDFQGKNAGYLIFKKRMQGT